MCSQCEVYKRERDAALDQVVVKDEALKWIKDSIVLQHSCGACGSEPGCNIDCTDCMIYSAADGALSNTSATAQRIREERENGTL